MKYSALLLFASITANLLYAQEGTAPIENWTEVNLAVTDAHVIPRYAAFSASSAELSAQGTLFCQSPTAQSLQTFQDAFHASMDAWQQIQHVQFGPVTYFNWNFRLHYWPDENGTGARQLDALIAGNNAEGLDSDNFARESVGVQGYPALESLLFADDSLQQLQGDPFRCQVAQTIARNIGEIASGVHTRWVDEFRTTVANADERGFFESAEDATIDFLKAQVEPVRRIQQQKIEAVLGENEARQRVRRAESWRSDRSIRNIKLNVLALEDLFNGSSAMQLNNVLYGEDVAVINTLFEELNTVLAALPDGFNDALALDAGRAQLLAVAEKLDALFEALEAGLKNTDLYLGFNSLDGD